MSILRPQCLFKLAMNWPWSKLKVSKGRPSVNENNVDQQQHLMGVRKAASVCVLSHCRQHCILTRTARSALSTLVVSERAKINERENALFNQPAVVVV